MRNGFTLAELLIALAILGVIATFTIPKVLQSQADGKFKAMGKETAGILAQAYEAYKLNNTLSAATTVQDILAPYLNYVRKDTTLELDQAQGQGTWNCGSITMCYVLHNGGVIHGSSMSFNGTGTTNAITFYFDPDGKSNADVNGAGKSIRFVLYYNGMLRTRGTSQNGTVGGGFSWATADPSQDPPWFDWN